MKILPLKPLNYFSFIVLFIFILIVNAKFPGPWQSVGIMLLLIYGTFNQHYKIPLSIVMVLSLLIDVVQGTYLGFSGLPLLLLVSLSQKSYSLFYRHSFSKKTTVIFFLILIAQLVNGLFDFIAYSIGYPWFWIIINTLICVVLWLMLSITDYFRATVSSYR